MGRGMLNRAMAIVCFVLILLAVLSSPVIWDDSLRNTYLLTLRRYLAKPFPPRFAFVGDSLTAKAHWGWALRNGRPEARISL